MHNVVYLFLWFYKFVARSSAESFSYFLLFLFYRESPRGIIGKMLDYALEVKEFKFQSRCYVHF